MAKHGPYDANSYSWICAFYTCVAGPSTFVVGQASIPSVVRTGTGNLDLIAGGSFSEQSLYGVYTAGTQSAPILDPNGNNLYNQPLGLQPDGTLLGAINADKATAAQAAYQAWYPEHGGDVLVSAQGNVTGYIGITDNTTRFVDSDLTSNWLWRQGGGGLATDPTAWWVNFGTYATTTTPNIFSPTDATVVGFQGIGTLGGGNLTVIAGGNAGRSDLRPLDRARSGRRIDRTCVGRRDAGANRWRRPDIEGRRRAESSHSNYSGKPTWRLLRLDHRSARRCCDQRRLDWRAFAGHLCFPRSASSRQRRFSRTLLYPQVPR